MNRGTKNLNTYRILYLIKGILNLVGILIFLFYAMIGAFTSSLIKKVSHTDPTMGDIPVDPGQIFITIGIVGMIICAIVGTMLLLATKHWRNRTNRKFITIAAGINCLTGLLGILLCIFTVVELGKPEVKAVFDGTPNGGASEDLLD